MSTSKSKSTFFTHKYAQPSRLSGKHKSKQELKVIKPKRRHEDLFLETQLLPRRTYVFVEEAPSDPKVKLKMSLFQPFSLIQYLDLFHCRAEIGAFTNFSCLTKSTRDHQAMPNRLEGFTFKSSKCFTNDWWRPQVLKDSVAHFCSQSLNLSTQLTKF